MFYLTGHPFSESPLYILINLVLLQPMKVLALAPGALFSSGHFWLYILFREVIVGCTIVSEQWCFWLLALAHLAQCGVIMASGQPNISLKWKYIWMWTVLYLPNFISSARVGTLSHGLIDWQNCWSENGIIYISVITLCIVIAAPKVGSVKKLTTLVTLNWQARSTKAMRKNYEMHGHCQQWWLRQWTDSLGERRIICLL